MENIINAITHQHNVLFEFQKEIMLNKNNTNYNDTLSLINNLQLYVENFSNLVDKCKQNIIEKINKSNSTNQPIRREPKNLKLVTNCSTDQYNVINTKYADAYSYIIKFINDNCDIAPIDQPYKSKNSIKVSVLAGRLNDEYPNASCKFTNNTIHQCLAIYNFSISNQFHKISKVRRYNGYHYIYIRIREHNNDIQDHFPLSGHCSESKLSVKHKSNKGSLISSVDQTCNANITDQNIVHTIISNEDVRALSFDQSINNNISNNIPIDEQVDERANEQINVCIDEQTNEEVDVHIVEQANEQISVQIVGHINTSIDEETNEEVDAHIVEQANEQISVCIDEQTNEQIKDQAVEQANEQISSYIDAQTNEQVNDQIVEQANEQVNCQTVERTNDQISACIDEQTNKQVNIQTVEQATEQITVQIIDHINKQHTYTALDPATEGIKGPKDISIAKCIRYIIDIINKYKVTKCPINKSILEIIIPCFDIIVADNHDTLITTMCNITRDTMKYATGKCMSELDQNIVASQGYQNTVDEIVHRMLKGNLALYFNSICSNSSAFLDYSIIDINNNDISSKYKCGASTRKQKKSLKKINKKSLVRSNNIGGGDKRNGKRNCRR